MAKKDKSPSIQFFQSSTETKIELPFVDQGIRAGFPSPAQDYLDLSMDLNRELINHPASTFCGRVVGDSMIDAGLEEGDILVIDKSIEMMDGDMIVCFVDGDFTIKYIQKEKDKVILLPANKDFPPIILTENNQVIVWGVVTYSIKKQLKRKKKNVRAGRLQ